MNKKTAEILIFGALGIAFAGLAVYVWKQANELKNACYVITGGSVNSIDTDSINLTLLVKVKNISDITITINQLELDIYVNNLYITHISSPVNQQVISQAYTTLSLPIVFNPQDALKAGASILGDIFGNKSNIVITTKGTASIDAGGVRVSNYTINDSITLQQIQDNSKQTTEC